MAYDLERFVRAQEEGDGLGATYADALNEIRGGWKQSHWIWYVFPQLRGLGRPEIVVCALAASLLCVSGAFAQQSSEVRAQAENKSEQLQQLVEELSDRRAEVNELDRQIDEIAQQSVTVQGKLIKQRQTLSQIVSSSYKDGGIPTIIEVTLASKSLEEFIANLYYARKVTEWQASCIQQLNDSKQELDKNMVQIEQSRNDRAQALEDLDASRESLEQTINSLLARAATLEEEERIAEEARLAEIARQAELEEQRREEEKAKEEAARKEAERLEAERQQAEAERQRQEAEHQEEAAHQEAERQRQESESQQESGQDPSSDPTADEPTNESSAGEWVTCIASAYTIADNDPPGSTATASGIPLDESVPTVAMPMSMNPAQFYGSKIQIEYQGMTIIATVTDCGYLSGGARGLDITPAIFRAFGFWTADDWGLRQVRYRFL